MRVLIVDNKSAHLERLKALIENKLGQVKFLLLDPREVQPRHIEAAELVVISGGWGRSIAKNPKTFQRVIKMLEEQKKPAIGICLGAEAIAAAYGATLREMPVRRVGNIRISLAGKVASAIGGSSAMVYEFHKWLIEDLPPEIVPLAHSKDGVEVLRHRDLPLWGVQFHPEVLRLNNKGHLIFDYILREVVPSLNSAHAKMSV